MSNHRVFRTVRLLDQTVKIGILEKEIENESANNNNNNKSPERDSVKAENFKSSQSNNDIKKSDSDGIKPKIKIQTDPEILKQIELLQDKLADEELKNVELTEAKNKLESEINGVKLDYEGRKRELENNAAANAKKIADEAKNKGYDDGFKKGHKEGIDKARKEIEKEYLNKFADLMKIIDNVGDNLNEKFTELVKLNQPRLIRVWTEMLRKMLNRQVELNPDTIDDVLTELLTRLSDKNQIIIYVSPDDAKHLEAEIDTKFQEVLRGVKRLEIKSDKSVDPGSCIVETGLGVYDARWKTQMSQVESVVNNIFQQMIKDEKDN